MLKLLDIMAARKSVPWSANCKAEQVQHVLNVRVAVLKKATLSKEGCISMRDSLKQLLAQTTKVSSGRWYGLHDPDTSTVEHATIHCQIN